MRRPFRRFPRVRQHDQSDCGAACLDAVARYHGLSVPLPRIRHLASTDTTGTNVLGMVEAAKQLGFIAKGVRAPPDSLESLPTPFIAHLILPGGLQHYVVVTSARNGSLTMMDPADGELSKIRAELFRERWTGVLILLAPGEGFKKGNEKHSAAFRFVSLLRPHRLLLAQTFTGALIYTLLGLSTAIYVQKIVDHVLVGGNRNLLNLLSTVMLVVLGLQLYIGSARSFITLRTGQHIDAALIVSYYRHLLSLPQHFFDTMRTGELISRVGDAVKIRAFINDVVVDLLVSAMVVVLSSALMLTYSVELGLIVICIIPFYTLIYHLADRANRKVLRSVMQSAADMESQLIESVAAIATVKRFGLEAKAGERIESAFVRLLRAVYSSGRISIFSSVGTEALSKLAVIAALWIGSAYVLEGELTPGELMSFYALIAYFTGPATRLVTGNRAVQDALIAADRLFEIMDVEAEKRTGKVIPKPGWRPTLEYDHVTLRYGSGPAVLRELSLRADAGSMIAVVGESGCGKSSLMAVAHGLYPVSGGHVRIGGIEISLLDGEWLRQRVAIVPQTIHLFAGTVIENIAVGEDSPNVLRILDIAQRLGISDFVEQMPQGYHTRVGENGALLSGGQRQRIALARALYLEPDILLLDEATSSLDAFGEAAVWGVLSELAGAGTTVVTISHRLASVTEAHTIFVLDDGQVREAGRHRDLISRPGGMYRRLWDAQNPANAGSRVDGAMELAPI